MDKLTQLADQHIRESELRLKHIDELMAKGRSAAAPTAGETQALLDKLQADRDRLAGELDLIRRLPPATAGDRVQRSEGLKGVLETVGLQLEQALTAVLEQGKH
jgi:hypothetical protein